jgi:tRNA(Ile)-lysidine synthase
LPPALGGRVIRAALQQVRGNLRNISATHVADVLKLISVDSPQGELSLPGVWVARRYEKLLFRKRKPESVEQIEIEIAGPGSYPLPDGRLLRVSLEKRALGERAGTVEFAATCLPFPLQLRHCQPGDRFRPSAMFGSKKLQDFFVDLKLTKEERQKVLLLLKDDEVVWVVGLRRAEGRLPKAGASVLKIVVEP